MLLLLVLIALLVILTGSYNVAVTERHNPITAWALDNTFRNSVQGHGNGIDAPELTPAMFLPLNWRGCGLGRLH